MTNPANTGQRTGDRKKSAPSLNRANIEQAFFAALDSGPKAISQQVRYILALSQMTAAEPTNTPYCEKPQTIPQARLAALAQLVESMSPPQKKRLIREVSQITDLETRLQLLIRLALHISPQHYRALIRDLWSNTHALADPVVKARILFQLVPLLTLLHDEPSAPGALLEVIALAQSIGNTEARIRSLVALAPHLPQAISIRLFNRVLDEVDKIPNDSLRCNAISAISKPLPHEVEERALETAEKINAPSDRARALTALARHIPDDLQPRLRAEALAAIQAIPSEEERAEALMAFAPNLEYASEEGEFPDLLAKALQIAVSMVRRHIRAKVLVGLAPHLTLDLQGEALAAVHTLSNERDRAMLLAELAPTLPPEMLVASLAIAHTMRQQDARVHALTVLAHYVPPHARDQTLLDALAAASNLPHHYERVTALIALIDILPDQLRTQAYTNALETTRLIDNENARARALSQLGQHLPPHLLKRALESAYEISDLQQRLSALTGLVPYAEGEDKEQALGHLLESARALPFEYKRARALVSAAPLLSPALLQEAVAIADNLEDPYDRITAYIAIVQHLPPEERPDIVARAWALTNEVDDGYDQASALAAIAPFVPEALQGDLARMAGMIIGGIMDEYDQASAITILAPMLADSEVGPGTPMLDAYHALEDGLETAINIPQQSLRAQLLQDGVNRWVELADRNQQYALWRQVAKRLATLPLADVLLCLGILFPVIELMAGEESLQDIAHILGSR